MGKAVVVARRLGDVQRLTGMADRHARFDATDGSTVLLVWQDEPPDLGGLDADGWWVGERRLWDGPATVVRFSWVRRRPDLSPEQFARHWAEVHAPLARRHHPVLVSYVQNVVLRSLTPSAPTADGIAELGVADAEDFEHRMYDSPEGRAIVAADLRRFLELDAGRRVLARPRGGTIGP